MNPAVENPKYLLSQETFSEWLSEFIEQSSIKKKKEEEEKDLLWRGGWVGGGGGADWKLANVYA